MSDTPQSIEENYNRLLDERRREFRREVEPEAQARTLVIIRANQDRDSAIRNAWLVFEENTKRAREMFEADIKVLEGAKKRLMNLAKEG